MEAEVVEVGVGVVEDERIERGEGLEEFEAKDDTTDLLL